MTNTITRKEIAAAADVSEDTVTRREKSWGLDKCISQARQKPVSFFRDKVNQALISRGIISKPI